MTTFTLQGFTRRDAPNNSDIVSQSTLSFTVPDGFDDIVYELDGFLGDFPVTNPFVTDGVSRIEFGPGIGRTEATLNGAPVPDDAETSILEATAGPIDGAILLLLIDPVGGDSTQDTVFQIGGRDANLTLESATNLFNTVDPEDLGFRVPQGSLGPDQRIPITSLQDVEVSGGGGGSGGGGAGTGLQGDGGNNTIRGTAQDDEIDGKGGNDKLVGRGGNDDIVGGNGADTLNGGSGDDDLEGGKGKDKHNGGGGNDDIEGGGGRDTVKGGGGNDDVEGGGGGDRLSGNKGEDTLSGGGGRDTFVLKRNDGNDLVDDFQDNRDTLELKSNLWQGNLSVEEVIARYADEVDDDLVFAFPRGAGITLEGITEAQVANDIDIV